jgi:hypothetical protein
LQRAERSAVLWFSEVMRRELYRDLGYGSIYHYATESLGFSKSKTAQFIRLSHSLGGLPRLRRAVATGEVSWTKARAVVTVATSKTEAQWVEAARSSTRRELETKIAAVKGRANAALRAGGVDGARGTSRGAAVQAAQGSVFDSQVRSGEGVSQRSRSDQAMEIPITLQLRFTSVQLARFEGLVEKMRKQGHRGSREKLVLAALEAEVVSGVEPAAERKTEQASKHNASRKSPSKKRSPTKQPKQQPKQAEPPTTRIHTSPYQVIVYRCESCGQGHTVTSRGEKPLDGATLQSILCDAQILARGKRKRATVSPGKRRQVLERDGHRCRTTGCGSRWFLEVHHLVPVELGGGNEIGNLVTLCRSCHTWVHRRAGAQASARVAARTSARDNHAGDQVGEHMGSRGSTTTRGQPWASESFPG